MASFEWVRTADKLPQTSPDLDLLLRWPDGTVTVGCYDYRLGRGYRKRKKPFWFDADRRELFTPTWWAFIPEVS